MNEPAIDQWGSHLPALVAAVAATDGPILECGVGIWSTPILHALCAPKARPLLSIESKPEWLARFLPFRTDWHQVEGVPSWDALPQGTWALAFVDHGHAPRGPVVEALRGRAGIVVMHDSECSYCGYGEALRGFEWVHTHTHSPAWTTIAGLGQPPAWLDALQPGVAGIPGCYR